MKGAGGIWRAQRNAPLLRSSEKKNWRGLKISSAMSRKAANSTMKSAAPAIAGMSLLKQRKSGENRRAARRVKARKRGGLRPSKAPWRNGETMTTERSCSWKAQEMTSKAKCWSHSWLEGNQY